MTDRQCSISGCDNPYRALGYCQKHYARFRAHGDPLHERTTWDRRGRSNALLVLPGEMFGRWTVAGDIIKQEDGQARFPCRCVCGTEREVLFRVLTQARKGKTSGSCGCAQREVMSQKRKHEVSPTDIGYHRARYLWAQYKMTPQEIRDMLKTQDYLCGICPTKIDEKTCRLDHDHTTSERRGLLCHHCNVGIGHFKDSIPLLLAAVHYLEKYKATERVA